MLHPDNQTPEIINSKTIRFALVGCGRIAERHAEHILKKGVLAAACDIVEEKATLFAAKYGARPYFDIADLLSNEKDLDVAVICTPNGLHAPHSIACFDAGFHVLCEKPMAITVEDCEAMKDAAARAGKLLVVVKQNRFNPPVVAVKQLLDEGRLGKIFSIQLNCFWNRDEKYYKDSPWKGTAELDGGILFTQFSHFIDLLYWLLGDIRRVKSFCNNYAHRDTVAFEDSGVVIMEFDSGTIGTMHYTVNSYGHNMEGSLTIFAENGTVKIGGEYLDRLEYQRIDGYAIGDVGKNNGVNDYGTYKGSMSNHDKVYDNLADVLLNGAAPNANAEDGTKTVEIIQKINHAAIMLGDVRKPQQA